MVVNEAVDDIGIDVSLGGRGYKYMFYEVDQAAQANRAFNKTMLYAEIDWRSFDQIVDAYRQRIHDWYLDPAKELAKNEHFAFAVMALNCLLIDTLSQFGAGIDSSDSNSFKEFIRQRLPGTYSCSLKTKIQHYDGTRKKRKMTTVPLELKDVADVLYHGFRCGILHQAHIPPYGGVVPKADTAVSEISGFVKYKHLRDECPSIVMDPLRLLEDLDATFEAYIMAFKDRDPKNEQLRANFKRKFSVSFGIDIDNAA